MMLVKRTTRGLADSARSRGRRRARAAHAACGCLKKTSTMNPTEVINLRRLSRTDEL
jgi:hypothetical protein